MENVKDQRPLEENTFLIAELQKAITNNEQELFDCYLKRYKELLQLKFGWNNHTNVVQARLIKKCDSQLMSDLFQYSLTKTNSHYKENLYQMCDKHNLFQGKDTELLRICIREDDAEMAHRFIKRGANLNDLDSLCCTPLEDAIRCKSLEIVCMLLYYGAYTNNIENNLTSFMFSIICQCSEEIQRTLMEYEADYNLSCDGEPILWMALKYHSPVVFDLIERGANPSFIGDFPRGLVPTPFLAIKYKHDVETVTKLWDLFDYKVWEESILENGPPTVLCRYLQYFSHDAAKYLPIFLNNEKQLRHDINYHEKIHPGFSFIGYFSSNCFKRQRIDENLIHNYILHLLSQGAVLYRSDIDKLYSFSCNKESKFFDILLSMEFKVDKSHLLTFMYFKYTLVPSIKEFTKKLIGSYNIPAITDHATTIKDVRDVVRKLSEIFALDFNTKTCYNDIFGNDEEVSSYLKLANGFPSLVELSREASRFAICAINDIQSINQFYSVVHQLDIPHFIKMLLVYNKKIYKMNKL